MRLDATSGPGIKLDATQIGRDVDEACDRFEAAWRAGERPSIEDFLGDRSDRANPVRLRYLLAVELDYRRALGETPGASEYRSRFPGQEGMIDSVFSRFAGRDGPGARTDLETLGLS